MTDNVITLPTAQAPADQIWVCGHCGQSVFELYRDGTTGCRGCGHRGEHPNGAWENWEPTAEPPDRVTRTTTVFDSASFAQRSIINSIDDEISVLVIAKDDGMIRAWSAYNHESSHEAKTTVRYLLAQAASLILGDPPLERPDDALSADKDDDV